MFNSINNRKIERLAYISTIADGIAVKEPGANTFDLCSKYVDDIVTVSDDEISCAILTLIEQHKLIAEGAGAVSVAAAMINKVPIEGKNVICVVSGGNIDVNILDRVIKRGLLKGGRTCMLTVELIDKPGQLLKIAKIIAEHGGNVTGVHHERSNANLDINGCFLRISMETKDFGQIEDIKKALIDEGVRICQ